MDFPDQNGAGMGLAALGMIIIIVIVGEPEARGDNSYLNDHKPISCTYCHPLFASSESADASLSNSAQQCQGCHSPGAENVGPDKLGFHVAVDRACSDCHFYHQKDRINARGKVFSFDYGDTQLKEHCLSCHEPGQSPANLINGHRRARLIYHLDHPVLHDLSPSEACLRCHAAGTEVDTEFKNGQDPPGIDHSAGHSFGSVMAVGYSPGGYSERASVDSRLRLINRRIECQTCHKLTAVTKNLLPDFKNSGDLCLTCHMPNRR